jgi:hypothetical protein
MGPGAGAQITKAPDALERSQGRGPKSASPSMKKQTQVRPHGGPVLVPAQLKIPQGQSGTDTSPVAASIALFTETEGTEIGGTSDELIDLSGAEYEALKWAALAAESGFLMFMANAALEKIGWPHTQVDSMKASKRGTRGQS